MIDLLLALVAAARVFFRERTDTALEVLALRQQLAVFKRKTTTGSEATGPPLLGMAPAGLATMEGRSVDREARDRCPLASRRLPPLPASAVAAWLWAAQSGGGD